MKKILVVCGPTAIGKTSLAIHLIEAIPGEIISADSRQVYRDLDIGTGKDLGKDLSYKISDTIFKGKRIGYYASKKVKIWGYDLVDPKKTFSAGEFSKIAKKILDGIWKRGKLPVLVGGTRLYIESVVGDIPTIDIPKNSKLRKLLTKKSVEELFNQLATMDPIKAASLNVSDKKNPRRLIRAIEVAIWKETKGKRSSSNSSFGGQEVDVLKIGLKMNEKDLFERIKRRVNERLDQGFDKEVRKLVSLGVNRKHQSMGSLGYAEWVKFLAGEISRKEAIRKWQIGERRYSKKQLSWFKRDKDIVWFDAGEPDFAKNVEMLVKKWYKESLS